MRPPDDPGIERLSLAGLFERFLEQLHLDRGIGYTLKLLLFHPRRAIEEYLFEDRLRMIRPFTLLLLSVGVATFLSLQYLLQEGAVTEARAEFADLPARVRDALVLLIDAMRQYFNLFYMSSLLPMTLATFLVFKAQRLNFAEHLVLNSFLFSVQTIGFILTIPLLTLRASWLAWIVVVPVAYTVWFYKEVFGVKWGAAVLQSTLVFVLGQTFWLVLGGLAFGVFLLASG